MKYPLHLSPDDDKKLEFEVVSDELKIRLTRMLEKWIVERSEGDEDIELIWKNKIVNKSRSIAGGPIYILKADGYGMYLPQEHAYHNGEMALVLRRLQTPELADLLCDMLYEGFFDIDEVNNLLEKDGVSFRFREFSNGTAVDVFNLDQIEETESEDNHPNIRLLISRMMASLNNGDFAGVLHASASVFETLAKIVVGVTNIQDKTLASFFDRYRKDSGLPEEILDYILTIYKDRNTSPLAGHGSMKEPSISKMQAVVLTEMTKAFVKIETTLQVRERESVKR